MATTTRRRVRAEVQGNWLTAAGLPRKDGRGGRRAGAGRPPKAGRAGAPHKKRTRFAASQPIHVVLRAIEAIGSLRRRVIYRALHGATLYAARRADFRIVHLSLQQHHVHLLVEASSQRALARGMQGFQISAAKRINAALGAATGTRRRGSVFPDRYHPEIIKTPRQARHALAYVLNNWRKHREDQDRATQSWKVDPFSTGVLFDGWKEREGQPLTFRWRDGYNPLVVMPPRTWLLNVGWRRHGLVRYSEVPGKRSGIR